MKASTKEIIVGGLMMALLIGVLGLSYGGRAKVESGLDRYLIKATFNRVDGLFEGDEVRLGGIRVGTVEYQALDSDYRAVVTMRIDTDVKLPLDTSVAIHTDGLFGSKYMVLEPGGEEEFLRSGDSINFAQDAVIVSDLLELIIAEGKANRKKDQ